MSRAGHGGVWRRGGEVRFGLRVPCSRAAVAVAVRAYGMDPTRADKVWDVAALHATGGIADCKSPGTAVAVGAIGTDVTGLGLDRFAPDDLTRIMATRPGFARPFIDAVVTDLRDKPQVASSTWMATIAADHIPGFAQARVGQLALAHPFETVKSQAQAP